jgi:hypothetical protein
VGNGRLSCKLWWSVTAVRRLAQPTFGRRKSYGCVGERGVAGNGRSSYKLWWLVTAVRGINRGRSEVVVLVREVVWVTAVHPANCGVGYGRARRKSWSVRVRPK